MTRRHGQKPAAGAADDAWTTVLSPADATKAKAAAKELARLQAQAANTSQGRGAGKGGGRGNAAAPASHGMKPLRPLQAGDDPPGVLAYDAAKPSWCEFSWRGQRWRCNTAFGGWTCMVCAMPSNRSERTHCCCCGAKPKPGCPTVDPAPTSTAPAPQAAAGTGGASSTSDSEGEVMDLTDKCVAIAYTVPSLDDDLEALSWPSEKSANEPLAGKGRLPAADAAAQKLATAKAALTVAQAMVQMMASSALQSKETQVQLAKEVTLQLANVEAAQKAADAVPTAAQGTAKTMAQQLVNAPKRLANCTESYLEWHQKATDRKVASELKMTNVANRYSELAAALVVEKQKYLDQARLCVGAWGALNTTIEARMKAEVHAVELEVMTLTPAKSPQPLALPAPAPVVAPPPPSVVVLALPPLQPLTQLPPMDLPDDEDYVRTLASVRLTLHELHDQEEEVRSSYPVTFAHLVAHGITWEKLAQLLPEAIVGAVEPAADSTNAWRLLGALRRRLDGLATLWDVKHAMLSSETAVVNASQAFTTCVLDQAKSKRKRAAPDTPDPPADPPASAVGGSASASAAPAAVTATASQPEPVITLPGLTIHGFTKTPASPPASPRRKGMDTTA